MDRIKRFAPLVVLILVVIAAFASGVTRYLNLEALQANEAALRGYIDSNLILALATFVAIYAIATAVSLPGATILTLAGGYLFGTWIGGSATVVGATLGAVLVFYAVRTSLGEALRARAEASGGMLKTVIDGVGQGAFGYILTLRLIPLAPFWLVNVAAALAHAPLRAYALATLIGIIPATFIYSGIGAGIGSLVARGETPDLGVIFEPKVLLPLVALGLLSLGTTLYQRRKGKSLEKTPLKVDLVVIGAGSGGLSVAAGAAQLGLKVVLFEKGEMGGDCLNYGCVPSKALIAAAAKAHHARSAGLGIGATDPVVNFAEVMGHVHKTIATIAPVDSQERFEGLGVQVVRSPARFLDARTVTGGDITVQGRKVVIATGSRAAVPPIPGLEEVGFLTNETVFELTDLPRKLIVLGGGPIGVELGQAFRRLGSEVVLVEAADILGREDPEASHIVLDQLIADGVELHARTRAVRAETGKSGPALIVEGPDGERRIEGSHLLVAVGRKASTAGLDLEKAGIVTNAQGIVVDQSLRTSNRRVHAVGDVAGRGQFTHLAGAHASLFVRKAIFAMPVNADSLAVPRVTYCDPELAAIGLSEADARSAHGSDVRVETFHFDDNDRAQAEGDVRGLGKLITTRKGKVLGVTLVGSHAGDHIHVWALALSAGLKLSALTGMIAPYPTRGEINKRLAGMWYTPALFSDRTRKLVSVLKHLA
jgi:pyruvate/2-oxoglutarate dehydrogenase complex dihydrolipoamide dehydrogenase (E3) component/uncharacterized membrane protein YdjX (TVP38/TMEM64 family)